MELSIKTHGNHRFAQQEAVEALVGTGAVGTHLDHGFYEYEVVKARLTRTGGIGGDATPEPELCDYCHDHPREPGVPCCDNSECKARYLAERQETR